MHGIRCQINFARPSNRTVLDKNLGKAAKVGQLREDTRRCRMHQGTHVDHARKSIDKTDL